VILTWERKRVLHRSDVPSKEIERLVVAHNVARDTFGLNVDGPAADKEEINSKENNLSQIAIAAASGVTVRIVGNMNAIDLWQGAAGTD